MQLSKLEKELQPHLWLLSALLDCARDKKLFSPKSRKEIYKKMEEQIEIIENIKLKYD